MASVSTSAAPWRSKFTEQVGKMAQATFTLATVAATDGRARARTCIYRGMWGTLPENRHNPAERNPDGEVESDMPVFTTDARMAKAGDLGHTNGGGGGAAAEAVWWVEETQTQWRVRGAVWMLGRAVPERAREALEARMRRKRGRKESDGGGWSWEREVTGHFGNLSPMMRGTFRNPPPGTARAEEPRPDTGLGMGQKVEDLEDAVARENFLVCILVPDEVDQLVLSSEDPRRYLHRYVGGKTKPSGGEMDGDWETVELWP